MIFFSHFSDKKRVHTLKFPDFSPAIFLAEQTLQLFVLRVKANRKKNTNKKYGRCQVQPIFETFLAP